MLDLTVFVHNGVDGVVVAGAVDQGGTLICATAAGCEAQYHDHSQKQSKNLLHVVFLLLLFMGSFYQTSIGTTSREGGYFSIKFYQYPPVGVVIGYRSHYNSENVRRAIIWKA